jgi:Nickel responsive protein SCO4226-like
MAEFLVEVYAARTDIRSVQRRGHRALRAADALTREGTPVTYVSSIFVPCDETCFFLFEAGSIDAVREAAHRAGLAFENVAEMVSDPTRKESFRVRE